MVNAKRKEALVAEITTGKHSLLSGLTEKLGGHDEGPGPHELLEAALAACTILTGQLYANRKGMKLESVDVAVHVESEGAETKISRKISLRGELSEDERLRLSEILNKCPVHKLLESKVTIETSIK
jgi:putative redox protein